MSGRLGSETAGGSDERDRARDAERLRIGTLVLLVAVAASAVVGPVLAAAPLRRTALAPLVVLAPVALMLLAVAIVAALVERGGRLASAVAVTWLATNVAIGGAAVLIALARGVIQVPLVALAAAALLWWVRPVARSFPGAAADRGVLVAVAGLVVAATAAGAVSGALVDPRASLLLARAEDLRLTVAERCESTPSGGEQVTVRVSWRRRDVAPVGHDELRLEWRPDGEATGDGGEGVLVLDGVTAASGLRVSEAATAPYSLQRLDAGPGTQERPHGSVGLAAVRIDQAQVGMRDDSFAFTFRHGGPRVPGIYAIATYQRDGTEFEEAVGGCAP